MPLLKIQFWSKSCEQDLFRFIRHIKQAYAKGSGKENDAFEELKPQHYCISHKQ
ncbi:hypothetical protein H8959_022171 [Pygathrix nigripes]